MKEHQYDGFRFACRMNNIPMVKQFLKNWKIKDDSHDILYEDGIFFNIAISHDNVPLLKILLDYMYDTNQMAKNPRDNNTAQTVKYNKLQAILQEAKKEFSISEEINSLISDICKYNIYEENDEDSQGSLSDVEATTGNDHVLWDEYLHGYNKVSNKYVPYFKDMVMKMMYNMSSVYQHNSDKIRTIKEALSKRSNDNPIPADSTLYNWIKEYDKKHHKEEIYAPSSALTIANIKKLSMINDSKELEEQIQSQNNKYTLVDDCKIHKNSLNSSISKSTLPNDSKNIAKEEDFDLTTTNIHKSPIVDDEKNQLSDFLQTQNILNTPIDDRLTKNDDLNIAGDSTDNTD